VAFTFNKVELEHGEDIEHVDDDDEAPVEVLSERKLSSPPPWTNNDKQVLNEASLFQSFPDRLLS